MTVPAIGFVGFGEAGFHLAKGLRGAGVPALFAFDIHTHTPLLGDRIRNRAREAETTLVASSQELARCAGVLLSVVTADSALQAAVQTRPFLGPRHIFADLNSVSPARKRSIAGEISSSGAQFVEAAIMAPVPPSGHRVHILVNGLSAPALVEMLAPYEMRLELLSGEIGAAAAVKMCRSIIVKGMEALIFECVLGAGYYGADERVFASLDEAFPGMKWRELADYMVGRVVVHGARRAREMEEAAETLRAIGIEPIMAQATARRQDWCARTGLAAHFGADGPATYRQVLDVLGKAPE